MERHTIDREVGRLLGCNCFTSSQQRSGASVQAERDAKRYTAFEKKGALTAQAERLKSSMKESQLVNFRAETKSRCALFGFCFQHKTQRHGYSVFV